MVYIRMLDHGHGHMTMTTDFWISLHSKNWIDKGEDEIAFIHVWKSVHALSIAMITCYREYSDHWFKASVYVAHFPASFSICCSIRLVYAGLPLASISSLLSNLNVLHCMFVRRRIDTVLQKA